MDTGFRNAGGSDPAGWCPTAKDGQQTFEEFQRSGSLCSSQTIAASMGGPFSQRSSSYDLQQASPIGSGMYDDTDAFRAITPDAIPALHQEVASWLGSSVQEQPSTSAYVACVEMIRHHKAAEVVCSEQLNQRSNTDDLDEGSRMIVASWMVEVAEEFGLQQETLHSAVALLDRFLATSNGVPRCVLQLVAVGCLFLASKQLEVQHPSVAQLVAVAAHSFTANDLLRVERILLDALDFNVTSTTAYGFLHLLTQANLAANNCSSSSLHRLAMSSDPVAASAAAAVLTAAAASAQLGSSPVTAPMEVVVSLAMYLTELALLDQPSLDLPGSKLATAALLLAYATLGGDCSAWPMVLAVAGFTECDVAPVVAVLGRLHVAARNPPTTQLTELLMPLKVKFGQDCWCRVSTDVPAILQQQMQQ